MLQCAYLFELVSDVAGVSTPTVELNALLMKRGEQAMYKPLDTRAPNYYPAQNYNYRGMYNHRYFDYDNSVLKWNENKQWPRIRNVIVKNKCEKYVCGCLCWLREKIKL